MSTEDENQDTDLDAAWIRAPRNEAHAELIRIKHAGLYHKHLQDLLNKQMNARELRFVEAYVAGDDRSIGNAVRSALVAGYSYMNAITNAGAWIMNPYEHPPHEGTRRKPHVWAAIQRRRAEIANRTALTDVAIVNELRKIGMFNAGNFIKTTSSGDPYIDLSEMTMDDMAAIQEAAMEDFIDGRGEDARDVRKVRVKTHDKLGALNTLVKIYGLHQPSRHIISGDPNNPLVTVNKHDLSKLSEDELEEYMNLVKKMEGRKETIDVTPTNLSSQTGNQDMDSVITVEENVPSENGWDTESGLAIDDEDSEEEANPVEEAIVKAIIEEDENEED